MNHDVWPGYKCRTDSVDGLNNYCRAVFVDLHTLGKVQLKSIAQMPRKVSIQMAQITTFNETKTTLRMA